MKRIDFEKLARKEARAAYRWYLRQGGKTTALGFAAALAAAITHVELHPYATAKHLRGTRIWKLKKYPYYLVFKINPSGDLRGIAIAHTSRDQGYWWKRTR